MRGSVLMPIAHKQRPTYHFQRTPQHTDKYVREPQLVLCPTVVWQLHKVGQRVLLKNERELLVVARPVRDRRRDVQKYLEADLVRLISLASPKW